MHGPATGEVDRQQIKESFEAKEMLDNLVHGELNEVGLPNHVRGN